MRITIVGGTGTAGRAVTAAAQARGHHVNPISRGTGADVLTGQGLLEAFTGADVVVDTSSIRTLSGPASVKFFTTASQNVLTAARQAGVEHIVRLSIIGVDRNPHGFYAGQLAMENIYEADPVPTTILRAAQFHEFAAQTLMRSSFGPIGLAPTARVQPVSGQEVGERVVEIAEGQAQGRAADLAGPREEDLAELIRRYAHRAGLRRLIVPVRLPTAMMRGMAAGLQLPDAQAQLGSQTFAQWLERAA